MWEYVKLNVMLMVALVCGPLFAVLLSFYVDVISLSQQYKFLQHINYDWKLLMVFGIFWLGIYCALAFWSTLKRLIYKAPKLEWWQTEAIYHIYVKSFFDANGDGVGDLRGIIQKLDYIQSLGTRAILLSPFYPSGGKDGGFDVTSFIDVDPAYGSIKDFDELVDQVHRRDMHLIIDFVPTHTSSQHQWFVESCKDEANNRFKDFYIWHPSKDSQTPPNNWKSIYGGPAWTYVESRKAWYFHNYLPEQPSLNLRCADVKGELESVMTFWLERKRVDGLRLESAEHLFVSEKFENEPVANKFKPSDQLEYADFRHVHTTNLPATFELLNEWRRVVCSLSKRNKSDKVLIVNPTIGDYQLDKFYNYENKKGAHLAINPQLCGLSQKPVDKLLTDDSKLFKPRNLKSLIEDYLGQLPKNAWTSWQLGDHYVSRVASRIGSENVNLANALNLLLGGTSVVYYGEEIGMEDLSKESLKFEECQDELGRRRGSDGYLQSSRDFERTPMQWDNTNFAGFTRFNRTWLPVNPNFKEINVQVQTGHKRSTLSIFRDLIELRHHASFQYGAVKMVTVNDQVFSFLRKAFGCDVYLICMNMSDSNANVNLLVSNEIAPRAYVALYIPGTFYAENGCVGAVEDIDLEAKYKAKSTVLTKNVFLKAHDCLVLTWPTSD